MIEVEREYGLDFRRDRSDRKRWMKTFETLWRKEMG